MVSIYKAIEADLNKISKFINFKRNQSKVVIKEVITDFEKKLAIELNTIRDKKLGIEKELKDNKAELVNLEKNTSKLTREISSLEIENKIVTTKLELIDKILSAKNTGNNNLDELKNLLNKDFIDFANTESSLAEEAQAVLLLQAIEKELELIVNFSGIYNKNIIAIGGGFSGGKSAFVSSFFDESIIKLPIGIKPVTAIPTYIINGENNIVKGFSKQGGMVEIDIELYSRLSHDFVKSFSFNLKDIMPVMAIDTPMKNYPEICFIDTPGYNPAETEGFTSEDKDTAIEYLEQANSLIWMIGLDSNGTIPAKDLDFIEELNLENKKLYVVANKADLRAESDLESILDEIEESLEDYDIPFEGISAYSSNTREEYLFKKCSLFNFLESENNPSNVKNKILLDLNSIIDKYKDAINKDIQKYKNMKKELTSLELDLLESGYEAPSTHAKVTAIKRVTTGSKSTVINKYLEKANATIGKYNKDVKSPNTKEDLSSQELEESENETVDKVSERILNLKSAFPTKELEKQLLQVNNLGEKLIMAVNNIFKDF